MEVGVRRRPIGFGSFEEGSSTSSPSSPVPTRKFKRKTLWNMCNTLMIFLVAITIGVLFFLLSRKTSFSLVPGPIGSSDLDSTIGDTSLISLEDLDRTSVSVCTNLTVSISSKKSFRGETISAYNCPKSENPCAQWVCSAVDGRCHETVISGAHCFESEQCSIGSYCDISVCNCFSLPNTTTGCITSLDCTDTSALGVCDGRSCVNGRCTAVINLLGQCIDNSQCQDDQMCDPATCGCIQKNVTSCTIDTDCNDISDRGSCVSYTCQSNRCVETPTVECWTSDQCSSKNCDQTSCTCQPFIACEVDGDCPNYSVETNCSTYECQSGKCVLELVTNATCASDIMCDSRTEFCDQTNCTCGARPINTCNSDQDCLNMSTFGSCVASTCQAGECVAETIGSCFRDEQCTSTQRCDQALCTCVPAPVPMCEIDDDCMNVTNSRGGNCSVVECVSERCVETLLGDCWYDGNCEDGFSCDVETCTCVSISCEESGFNFQLLPDVTTGLNITCGLDVAVWGNNAVVLCLVFDEMTVDSYALVSYIRIGNEWGAIQLIITGLTNEGLVDESAYDMRMRGELVVLIVKTVTGLPNQAGWIVFQVTSGGFISQTYANFLPASSEVASAIAIWDTDIIIVNGDAFYYVQSSPTLWTLNQTINETVYHDCDIMEDGLVLSTNPSVFSSTYSTFQYDGAMWNKLFDYTNLGIVNQLWYTRIMKVFEPNYPNYGFTVLSTLIEQPVSVYQVVTSGGILLSSSTFVTGAQPGYIDTYENFVVLSENIYLNGLSDMFSARSLSIDTPDLRLVANGVSPREAIFSYRNTSSTSQFLVYANWCE